MNKIGFDNAKYVQLQSQNIRDRISQFGGKLYLEFGGKLFDDYHASRVLPGFRPDSKVRMLLKMKDEAEIVIAISADDIERNKRRGDLGITYDEDTLRLIDAFRGIGLYVGSVVITHYRSQPAAELFQKRLETLGVRVYRHYIIPDYPSNVELIVSENGFGKNDYIETERSLVVVTAPGPGSGKMATCLSQLYHEHRRGVNAGYAKFETFPIWNVPLKHPINLAYEAATADLDDINMIDPFHLEAYGETTVNYNRDVEIFPVLNAILTRIYGESAYKSPTDMGVNMAGYCITDDEACREASKQEIIRRYYAAACSLRQGLGTPEEVRKIELIMNSIGLSSDDRPVVAKALEKAEKTGGPAVAIELPDGTIITGKTSSLLGLRRPLCGHRQAHRQKLRPQPARRHAHRDRGRGKERRGNRRRDARLARQLLRGRAAHGSLLRLPRAAHRGRQPSSRARRSRRLALERVGQTADARLHRLARDEDLRPAQVPHLGARRLSAPAAGIIGVF